MFGRLALSVLLIFFGTCACAQQEPTSPKNTDPKNTDPKNTQSENTLSKNTPPKNTDSTKNDSKSDDSKSTEKPNGQASGNSDSGSQEPEKPTNRDSRSERETREIFFRTLNETRSRGAQEFGYLLFQKSVREEVGLDDSSAKAARDILSKSRSSGEKLYEQLKHHKISADELKTEFLKVMVEADREMWQVLGDNESKRERLIGLYVQLHKSSAALNKVVAEKIGLEDARRLEIIAKKEAIEREMFEESSRENAEPSDRFRSWERTQRKVHLVISEMLSQEQRAKLEGLKGASFEFEQFPFPPPGSPGRGRDGGRDRRNREDRDEKCRDCDKLVTDQH